MGYSTDFHGYFNIKPKPTKNLVKFINKLSKTRRMSRNVNEIYGTEGEFFIHDETDIYNNKNIISVNTSPETQPGLWCDWFIDEEMLLTIYGGKAYDYDLWLYYLIEKIFRPLNYILNGTVMFRGESFMDYGEIHIMNNDVYYVQLGEAIINIKNKDNFNIILDEKYVDKVKYELDLKYKINSEEYLEKLLNEKEAQIGL